MWYRYGMARPPDQRITIRSTISRLVNDHSGLVNDHAGLVNDHAGLVDTLKIPFVAVSTSSVNGLEGFVNGCEGFVNGIEGFAMAFHSHECFFRDCPVEIFSIWVAGYGRGC